MGDIIRLTGAGDVSSIARGDAPADCVVDYCVIGCGKVATAIVDDHAYCDDHSGKTSAPRQHFPAYADPDNEFKGSRFERGRDIKDIAKDVRQWLRKTSPGIKASVRIDRYSGGCSLRVCILDAPFDLVDPDGAYASRFGDVSDQHHRPLYTEQGREMIESIEDYVRSHKRDNSDTQSDYFDVNFYSSVSVDWEFRDAAIKAALERWVELGNNENTAP